MSFIAVSPVFRNMLSSYLLKQAVVYTYLLKEFWVHHLNQITSPYFNYTKPPDMNSKKAALFLYVLCMFVFIFSCNTDKSKSKEIQNDLREIRALREAEGQDLVARGEYLVTVGGCNDCHSPKILRPGEMAIDSSKLFSGHPANSPFPPPDPKAAQPGNWIQMTPDVTSFAGPWGVSYAANLTPDSATGIGAWTEDVFIKTLRTGKHLGQENGRHILPPMPWFNLAKMKTEDLQAIYAYLRSLPPINNRVPAPRSPEQLQRGITAAVNTKQDE